MHRFLCIYQFPKSNVISFEFRMRGPLKESTSRFLIRLSPLVPVPIGIGLKVLTFIFHGAQSPHLYLSQDSKSSLLSFIGLKVLCLYAFIGLKVLCHLLFKYYHSVLSCRDNQGHLLLYFSKTMIVFCLVETIKVIRSYTFQRLS